LGDKILFSRTLGVDSETAKLWKKMTRTGKPVWSILDVVHRFHRLASGEDEIGKVPQECSYSIEDFL